MAMVDFYFTDLDLAAGSWQAAYTVTANGLVVNLQVPITQWWWQVVGTFPNDGKGFDTPLRPRKPAWIWTKPVIGLNGVAVRWKPLSGLTSEYFDLLPCFQVHDNVVAYAMTSIKSPTRAARAAVGGVSDDGGKVVGERQGGHRHPQRAVAARRAG